MANHVGQGIVKKISQSQKNNLYSFQVGDDWIGAGKYAPKFKEGDEIKFEYTLNGEWKNLVFGSVIVVEEAKGPAPMVSSSSGSPVNWDKKDRRITYLACRKDALEMYKLASSLDAFPKLPTTKGDRYDAIKGYVDQLTNDFFNDVYGEDWVGE